MLKQIYTIGYSGFSMENFIKKLRDFSIRCVIDVRSIPYSQYFNEYDKEFLAYTLKNNSIFYRNYSREFGARQENSNYYTDGHLDFSKFTQSDHFKCGIQKIDAGIMQGYSFVLMCSEKNPIDCHRCIMIGREFSKLGYKVTNILPDKTIDQSKIDEMLLDIYCKNYKQLNFFESSKNHSELIEFAYKERGKEIAYRKDDKD